MKIYRLSVILLMVSIVLAMVVIAAMAQEPVASNDLTGHQEHLAFQSDPADLQPCGNFEALRLLETPAPVTPAPTNTPNPNAPAPTPTSTPRPAPSEDRVGFPENYMTDFKLLFVFDRPDRKLVRAICGNEIAAQHQDGEPFPYGSVLLMISYAARLDTNGQPVLDENGHFIRERLTALHVMRKEEGFGEAYGEDRAGEWEFIAFNGDGSYQNTAETTNFCAACHLTEGGESVDHVFRMNLLHEAETAFTSPAANENEISIYLYSFHEPVLEVKAGTTVTWINNDQAAHTVMAGMLNAEGKLVPADEPLFQSEKLASATTIQPGASFSYTFDEPGEFLYLCTIHQNMSGKIVVTN